MSRDVAFLALFSAGVATAMAFLAATPAVTVAEPPEVRLDEIPGYASEVREADAAELAILPKDTRVLKRVYVAGDGDWFAVTAVIGGTSKSSIHRPELCLPGQGFQMADPRTREAGGAPWRFITLRRGEGGEARFAYAFFNQEGFRTCSHVRRILRDVWDRSVLNRIDRWVMVTVHAGTRDDAALADFLAKLKGAVR